MSLIQPAQTPPDTPAAITAPQPGRTGALTMVTMLFFMWGLITALNDVLIPHLRAVYTLSYVQAMLVQSCFFGAYFLVSLPAGALVRRIGYQRGVVVGLATAGIGCLMFYPAAQAGFGLFLAALFVLASGITMLQVAANPYVTILGPAATASGRLTLTQGFNSLGTTVGPLVGAWLILSDSAAAGADAVKGPYLLLACTLLALSVAFALARLPQVAATADDRTPLVLRQHPRLVFAVLAIFLYVGAEVAIGSFIVSFLTERHIAGLTVANAAHYVSLYWGGAMVGRFVGALVMRRVSAGTALAFSAALAVALIVVAVAGSGSVAMWAILAVGLCNAIMFPTIFSMGLHQLGAGTGQAAGRLCMAIVGGAVVPVGQGVLADVVGVQWSFLLPAACYVPILWFGIKYAGIYRQR
ncbi:FHS family L-fucose permease-like MFS transporter [Duganella sp. 3397]|uniref:sugar MFS transporter n=1 Tax=Duganella sp. 3397 TaxID=2817732 RepID=UPI00285DBA00|nr:sugar MFS transporter [Duganella sp. 3397]MDR7048707.1 FHS family L-fucose permease-like MFS transporter [Duganella sp. 3397]